MIDLKNLHRTDWTESDSERNIKEEMRRRLTTKFVQVIGKSHVDANLMFEAAWAAQRNAQKAIHDACAPLGFDMDGDGNASLGIHAMTTAFALMDMASEEWTVGLQRDAVERMLDSMFGGKKGEQA